MEETILQIIISVILGALLYLILIYVEKISSIFRYILVIPTYILSATFFESFLPLVVKFLSIFWILDDSALNVYFFGAIILPFVSGYLPLLAVAFVSPNYKLIVAILFGSLQVILALFLIYASIFIDESDFSPLGIFSYFDLNVNNKIVFYLKYISFVISSVLAVFHVKNETSLFD